MLRNVVLAGIASLSVAASANAQMVGPSPAGGVRATTTFITKASQSDEFERQEGRLAVSRSHNPRVKAFAAEMVSAHTKTTAALKAAIRRAHVAPASAPMMTKDQRNMMSQLERLRGRAFDKAYVEQQVRAHKDALQLMDGYAQSGAPGPIHDAAQGAAPLVQHHLDMAKALQAGVGG